LRIESLEQALVIGVALKNGLACVAPGGEVIKRAGEFETTRPRHNGNVVLDAGRTCQGKVYPVSLTGRRLTPPCTRKKDACVERFVLRTRRELCYYYVKVARGG